MTEKSAILFDLDGTLVDTLDDIRAAFNQVLTEFNKPTVNNEQLKPLVSRGSPDMIPASFDIVLDSPEYHLIRDKILQQYEAENNQRSQLFPGVRELIDQLNHRQIPWGIVTNKTEKLAQQVITKFELDQNCQVLVGGDTLSSCKPCPKPLLYACEQIGKQPKELYFIGDSERDILAANAANIDSVTLLHGYSSTDLRIANFNTVLMAEPLEVLALFEHRVQPN